MIDKGGRTKRYLNINLPEHSDLRAQMQMMRRFYTDPVSLSRGGRDPIAPTTWDRVQLHLLSEWHLLPVLLVVIKDNKSIRLKCKKPRW